MKQKFNCGYCLNATTDPELTHDNDLSYRSIGKSDPGMRIMFKSGDAKPTEIIFELRDNKLFRWVTNAYYIPKYCPECGRKLLENERWLNNGTEK